MKNVLSCRDYKDLLALVNQRLAIIEKIKVKKSSEYLTYKTLQITLKNIITKIEKGIDN